jgi:hypothetical protein
MIDLVWFDLHPPRGLDLAAVVSLLRPLATRPRMGFLKRTPIVVIEARLEAGQVRWLLGLEPRLTGVVPGQFRAHQPGIGLVPSTDPARPAPDLAADIRLSSLNHPLRTDLGPSVSAGVRAVATSLKAHESAVLQWILGSSQQRTDRPEPFNFNVALGFQQAAPVTATDQQAWRTKSTEPIFDVRGRIGSAASTPERAAQLIQNLFGALAIANSAHCSLRATLPTIRRAHDLDAVRQSAGVWSSIVSAAELAGLLGWPFGTTTGASAFGQAPTKLVIDPEAADRHPGVRILGASLHPADRGQLVTMPLATANHGTQLLGPTGSGKSNQLAHMILADIRAGHGVLVVEPRGDLITDVLARIPAHRQADVVVIDPSEADQIGFNPLAGPTAQAEQRADELLGLLRAIFGTSAIGPRSSDALFHAILTAARMDDGTLGDVPILFGSTSFRRRALASVGDPLVLTRWWQRFSGLSDGEQQQIVAPVLNKLSPFLARQPIRRLLAQSRPRFSLDDLFLRTPKIVLMSLNRGVIGPEASRLLGSLLLSAAWSAAQRRATLPQSRRFPVMVTLDEFQDFVGALDFGEVLAQCRGLGISILAAHQHLSQLDANLRAGVTANARTRLAFRPSQDDAKALAATFGAPITAEDLLGLRAFEMGARMLVDRTMAAPFAVRTRPLGPPITDPARLRALSRQQYATNGAALDEALARRWYGEDGPPDAPIGTRSRRSA